MKKLLLLSISLLFVLAAQALDFKVNNLRYTSNPTGVTVSFDLFRETSLSGAVVIPPSVMNGATDYAVTAIGDSAFSDCWEVTSITIPASVTSIGQFAFNGCNGLSSIVIPSEVISIGSFAFASCTGIKDFYVRSSTPPVVDNRGFDEFSTSTCKLYVPVGSKESYEAANGWKDFQNMEESMMGEVLAFSVDNLKYITNTSGTFVYLKGYVTNPVGDLVIPSVVTYDGKDYPVTSIGDSAFYECDSLASIILPEGLTSIGTSAFEKCDTLSLVTLPESLTLIGTSAFSDCSRLTSITLPDSITSIREKAFQRSGLTSVTLPDSITSIESYLFDGCDSLTSISVPKSVTTIDTYAFRGCSALTSVAFEGVMSIYGYAFSDCSGLTSISLPSSVSFIGYMAFSGCTGLQEFHIQRLTPPDFIGSYLFDQVDLSKVKLYVPLSTSELYAAESPWNAFQSIEETDMDCLLYSQSTI